MNYPKDWVTKPKVSRSRLHWDRFLLDEVCMSDSINWLDMNAYQLGYVTKVLRLEARSHSPAF